MPRKPEPTITFGAYLDTLPPAATRAERGNPLSTDRHRESARRLVAELAAASKAEPTATASTWPGVITELAGYNGADWARVRRDGLAGVAALAPAAPAPKED
jgi:hypothetical protein